MRRRRSLRTTMRSERTIDAGQRTPPGGHRNRVRPLRICATEEAAMASVGTNRMHDYTSVRLSLHSVAAPKRR